jgi:hypothetical protein
MFVCCVLLGRSLCDELVIRPEESYRLWRVVVCDLETSWYEEDLTRPGLQSQRNKPTMQLLITRISFCMCVSRNTNVRKADFINSTQDTQLYAQKI